MDLWTEGDCIGYKRREAAETKSGSGSLNGISVGGFLRKKRGSFVFHIAPIHLHNSPTGGERVLTQKVTGSGSVDGKSAPIDTRGPRIPQ